MLIDYLEKFEQIDKLANNELDTQCLHHKIKQGPITMSKVKSTKKSFLREDLK